MQTNECDMMISGLIPRAMPSHIFPYNHPLLDTIRIRGFRRLWLGQIVSQLALNMLVFLLALVLYEQTGSNAAVSGLYLAYGVPAVFFGMVAGTIVDKLDRRIVLMLCDISRAFLACVLFFLHSNLAVVYVIVLVSSIINQFYIPSEAPSIPRLVPQKLLVAANSLFSFTYYTSMAFGFIVSGPVLRILGSSGAIILIAGLFVLGAFYVSGIPPQGSGVSSLSILKRYSLFEALIKVFSELLSGIRYVSHSSGLLDALLLLTGTQIMITLLGTLGPGFADRVLQIDVRDASVVIVGPTVVGIIAGALWIGNMGEKAKPKKLIERGIFITGVALMVVSGVVGATRTSWFGDVPNEFVILFALLLFLVLGIGNSMLDVPANSLLQKEADGPMRGRVYGILSASVGGVGILPIVLGGVLADVIGVGPVIFGLGSLILLYGIVRVRGVMKFPFQSAR